MIFTSDALSVLVGFAREIHWQSYGTALFLFMSYNIFSTVLQYYYYYNKRSDPAQWKVAPENSESLKHSRSWWIPALSYWSSKARGPFHALLASTNLLMSCIVGGFVTEMIMRGNSRVYWDYNDLSLPYIILGFLIGHVYQGVLEYYWHVGLHWGPLYRTFHKIHHFYKHPEPFDDMYIHPLEAFGYYCILFSPPLVLPMHIHAYLAYMVINGLTGVLDHSGIRFRIPNLYDTVDHDAHHSKFECNYAFPFPYLDILNGTYYGTMKLLGKEYRFVPTKWMLKQKQ
jgi:sterol desaturase/sphingolipid hydroxylase (fatty acid hydroxylase superfamily)